MQSYNQINRIIKMLDWLYLGERLSVRNVERRFECKVSKRQIQRDFNIIFDSDIPIEYEMNGKERELYLQKSHRRKVDL